MFEYLNPEDKTVQQTRRFLEYIGYPYDYVYKLSDDEVIKLYNKEKAQEF